MRVTDIRKLIPDVDELLDTGNCAPQHISDIGGMFAVYQYAGAYADLDILWLGGRRRLPHARPESAVSIATMAKLAEKFSAPKAASSPKASVRVASSSAASSSADGPSHRPAPAPAPSGPAAVSSGRVLFSMEPCKKNPRTTNRAFEVPHFGESTCLAQPWLGFFKCADTKNPVLLRLGNKFLARSRTHAQTVQQNPSKRVDWSTEYNKLWMQNTQDLYDSIVANFTLVDILPPKVLCAWPAFMTAASMKHMTEEDSNHNMYHYEIPSLEVLKGDDEVHAVCVWGRIYRKAHIYETATQTALALVADRIEEGAVRRLHDQVSTRLQEALLRLLKTMSAETAFSVIAHALSLWSRPWALDLLREIGGASAAELEDAILVNALALTTDLGVGVMPADDDARDEALKGKFRARVQNFFFNVDMKALPSP